MQKRGQITVFIIVGIIILVIIASTLYITKTITVKKVEEEKYLPIPSESFEMYIDNCLEKSAINSIVILGLRGGDLQRTNVLKTDFHNISYLLYGSENILPGLHTIEQSLSTFIEPLFMNCIDFSVFKGYDVSHNEPEFNFTIADNRVIVNLLWNVVIKQGKQQKEINKFILTLPFRVKKMHELAGSIVENNKQLGGNVDIMATQLAQAKTDISQVETVYIKEENSLIYLLKDNSTGGFYHFLFAVQLPQISVANGAPVLSPIPKLMGTVGEVITYQVEATDPEGDTLTFSISGGEFFIEKNTGLISAALENSHIGKNLFVVRVEDSSGNYEQQMIELEVNKVNSPPITDSLTNISLKVNEEFTTLLSAEDPDGDFLTFKLIEPLDKEITLTSLGLLQWMPTEEDIGNFSIKIEVADNYEGNTTMYVNGTVQE